jgi:subtilisin family serine protease
VSQYPNGLSDGVMAANWIDVAASTSANDHRLVASFSNYGATLATILAPGARISCAVPGGGMRLADGTSMAAPMVSGVAAVLKSQHPDLDAKTLRATILNGIFLPKVSKGLMKPGGFGKIDLSDLVEVPGVVNLKRALKVLDIPLKKP